MKRILLVKCGTTNSVVRERVGDYPVWFFRAMGGDPERFHVVDVQKGERLPAFEDYRGVILTGSPCSVTAPEPWMRELGEAVGRAVDGPVPVLCVCFGHQLAAWALGGRVERHPRGIELGPTEVETVGDDPLFAGLPRRATFMSLHEDHVTELPPGARLTARGDFTPVQGFGKGAVQAVQFHPEANVEVLRGKIEHAVADPRERARLLGALRDTPDGRALLATFERSCAG